MNKVKLGIILLTLIVVGFGTLTYSQSSNVKKITNTITQNEDKGGPEEKELHPLSIEVLRKVEFFDKHLN